MCSLSSEQPEFSNTCHALGRGPGPADVLPEQCTDIDLHAPALLHPSKNILAFESLSAE